MVSVNSRYNPYDKKIAELFGKSAIFVYLCTRITKIAIIKWTITRRIITIRR